MQVYNPYTSVLAKPEARRVSDKRITSIFLKLQIPQPHTSAETWLCQRVLAWVRS
jgi:hypothetical protein